MKYGERIDPALLRPSTLQLIEEDRRESLAEHDLKVIADELARIVGPIWQWGDGEGGHVLKTLGEAFSKAGLNGRHWRV
jgi:hypothetical protein